MCEKQEALFQPREVDLKMAEIYREFIPEKVFDAHAHINLGETLPQIYDNGNSVYRQVSMVENYRQDMAPLLPGAKQMSLNMIVLPDPILNDLNNGLRDKANDHVIKQHLQHPDCVATPYILSCDSEETIYALTERPGVRGLKCYSYGAGDPNGETLAIGDFLPETAWIVANEKKLPIILHMMRPAALSDPENFAYIVTMSHRYPNAQLVLAHCGRAFAAWTGVKAIQELDDCGNIWFDMAAICETGPMIASILKNAGKRTMWGSDYPISMLRGRAVSVGLGQNWFCADRFGAADCAFVATENLMAFWQTARLLNLDQTQVNDLFYGNACRLFQVNI